MGQTFSDRGEIDRAVHQYAINRPAKTISTQRTIDAQAQNFADGGIQTLRPCDAPALRMLRSISLSSTAALPKPMVRDELRGCDADALQFGSRRMRRYAPK